MHLVWQDGLETFALLAGLCYVVLAIREHRSCWIAGLLSTLAYGVVCTLAGLWLQAALQVIYSVLAVVGWWQWRQLPMASNAPVTEATPSATDEATAPLAVQRLSWRGNAALLALTAALTLAGHAMLSASGSTQPNSMQPWLEAATTAGGLVATWLATRKLLDNWSWWVVINVATAWLFWQAALRPTAGLYLAYAVLAVLGWREWRKQLA